LKIILNLYSFPNVSETFIVSKFLGLLRSGLDAHIVCSNQNKTLLQFYWSQDESSEILKRIHVNPPVKPYWKIPFYYIKIILIFFFTKPIFLFRIFQKGFKKEGVKFIKLFYLNYHLIYQNPDVISFEFGSLAKNKTFIKHILDCKLTACFRGHDIDYVGIEEPDYYTEVWKNIDKFHFLGKALYQQALNRGLPESSPYQLIPPAIDLLRIIENKKDFDENRCRKKTIRILSVGRLHWVKGYEFSLQGLKILREKNIDFEYQIIGSGKYSEAISFAIHQLGLNKSVELLGAKTHSEVIQHMLSADIFLHPAVEEGFGNVVLEAQALGLPVVCSDTIGLPENIEDGVTGYLFHSRDIVDMVEKLILLINNPKLRKSMGKAGMKRVEEKFKIEDQIQAWIKFYQDINN